MNNFRSKYSVSDVLKVSQSQFDLNDRIFRYNTASGNCRTGDQTWRVVDSTPREGAETVLDQHLVGFSQSEVDNAPNVAYTFEIRVVMQHQTNHVRA